MREVAGVESLEIDDMGEVIRAECEYEAAVCNGVTGALVLLRRRYRHARRPLGGGDRACAPCQADERAAEVVEPPAKNVRCVSPRVHRHEDDVDASAHGRRLTAECHGEIGDGDRTDVRAVRVPEVEVRELAARARRE